MKNLILIFSFTQLFACTPRSEKTPADLESILSSGTWIDLTYSFSEETIYWPSVSNTFRLDTVFFGHTPGEYFYSAFTYSAPEHGGTHLDAPIHFAEGKWATDEIPLENLTGNAIVIDVADSAANNRDYLITVNDVLEWEKKYGEIPQNAIVIFRTGFGKYYPDAASYLGTAEKGEAGIANLHFPGIDPTLADWLVKNRKIKAAGLDTASVDYGQSKDFKAHQILYEANIVGFENLANLDLLPEKGAFVIAMPMKIKGGSGAPLRIISWVNGAVMAGQ